MPFDQRSGLGFVGEARNFSTRCPIRETQGSSKLSGRSTEFARERARPPWSPKPWIAKRIRVSERGTDRRRLENRRAKLPRRFSPRQLPALRITRAARSSLASWTIRRGQKLWWAPALTQTGWPTESGN